MIIKIFGMLLVFLGCAGMGVGMARGVQKELKIAQELHRLIRRIGADVRCYKRPLPEIYSHFDSALLSSFLQKIKTGAVAEAMLELPEDPQMRSVCEPFFERVGRCSADECARLEEECAEELGRLIEQKKLESEAKAKVYRSLGIAGGAAAVILLI